MTMFDSWLGMAVGLRVLRMREIVVVCERMLVEWAEGRMEVRSGGGRSDVR